MEHMVSETVFFLNHVGHGCWNSLPYPTPMGAVTETPFFFLSPWALFLKLSLFSHPYMVCFLKLLLLTQPPGMGSHPHMLTYDITWHRLTRALTQAHFFSTLRAINAIRSSNKSPESWQGDTSIRRVENQTGFHCMTYSHLVTQNNETKGKTMPFLFLFYLFLSSLLLDSGYLQKRWYRKLRIFIDVV